MNRTLLLGLAVLLGLAGIAISVRDMLHQPPPPPDVEVAVAQTDIPTYTRIEAGMLKAEKRPANQAQYVYSYEDAIDMISTEPIKAGQTISRGEAKPVEEVRFVEDLGYEILSFSGHFDEMVGGQVKPGVRVNIRGYRASRNEDEPGEIKLIASNVWVVDVRASSGEAAGQSPPTPSTSSSSSGILGGPSITGRNEAPGSIVTVAVEPEVASNVIQALGADGYQAWVTLAGNQALPTSTPRHEVKIQATYTPLPTYTPFPSPTPAGQTPVMSDPGELAGTATPEYSPKTGAAEPGN